MPIRETMSESAEQIALFQWANLSLKKHPELALLYHIPNGGLRNVVVAARLKKEGVKKGVPDLCLPVARGEFHGLYIEMKAAKRGRVSDEQKQWLMALKAQGYCTEIAHGWIEAKRFIECYLLNK